MTRKDVIRMALEHFGATFKPSDLEVKLAMLAVAAEREACAKENGELLQALQNLHQRCHWADAPEEMDAAKAAIDKAIRARGER